MLVVELYKQGMTYAQIAKKAHVSLRDIGPILNNAGVQQTLSDSSRAYKLFFEGVSPIQVAIILNLEEPKVTQYYNQYRRLRQLYDLSQICAKFNEDISSFTELFRLMNSAKMEAEHVIRLLKIANNDLPSVERRIQELEEKSPFWQLTVNKQQEIFRN